MRAVDTNVLVRLITRDDAKQTASADRFASSGLWVSVLALAETIGVLTTVYGRTSTQLITVVEMLLDQRTVVLQHPEVVTAALERFRTKPSLGFSDCLMLELARASGHLPLGTFDRNLASLEGVQRLG